jgi:hypothetical protein
LIPRPATPSWRRPPQGLLARSIWHAPTYVWLSISSWNDPRSSCYRGHVLALR